MDARVVPLPSAVHARGEFFDPDNIIQNVTEPLKSIIDSRRDSSKPAAPSSGS